MGEFLSANTLTVDTILHLTEEKITAPDQAAAALDVIVYAFALPTPINVSPTPADPLKDALEEAFYATQAHADFIFQRAFKDLLLAQEVSNWGIVLGYNPAGDIGTVEQQLYATLGGWELPGDQALVQQIAALIYGQAAATGETPLATYGQSPTSVMYIKNEKAYALFACWAVAVAIFPMGDDQFALLYCFQAATTELSAVIV